MGRDVLQPNYGPWRRIFQSTLPAWGETFQVHHQMRRHTISIHSPRMGRDPTRRSWTCRATISIHSPRMGRDGCPCQNRRRRIISIHSPRMGRDGSNEALLRSRSDFNPLSPHGERRGGVCRRPPARAFQSTLPAWGETSAPDRRAANTNFNPLSPHGERLPVRCFLPAAVRFQSTLPAWGETTARIPSFPFQ